jgi:cation transport ATPase
MLSSDDTTQSTGAIEKVAHPYNHKDHVYERRQQILQQKQTDALPNPYGQNIQGRIVWRQYIQLREENKRLRSELAKYLNEIDSIHNTHQRDIPQDESRLEIVTAQLNRAMQDHQELEKRYQDLYNSFQNSVEEEAHNILAEAARTLELHTDNGATTDTMKTVELHFRQIEEQHTAESLYLLRQTQKKAHQLEHELAQERLQITEERENMQNLHNSFLEQAELRKSIVEDQLRAKFITMIIMIAIVFVVLLLAGQLFFISLFRIPDTQTLNLALILPVVICIVLVGILAYLRATARSLFEIDPPKSPD